MRALVASDLHFEFHRDGGRALLASLADADVCVCAGDLSSSRGLWDALVLLLGKYEHVVFVLGNHEFYNSTISAVREKVEALRARLPRMGPEMGQLHLLDNSACEIEGRRFVGTTLWFRDAPGNAGAARYLTDFHVIGNASQRIYEENERALAFLEQTVTSDDIVVTHHLPAEMSVHPRWKGDVLNAFFLCDVEPLIRERQPKMWVHGHTHDSCDYTIGTTQVVCNPFGYAAHEENAAFNPGLVVEL